MSARAFDLTAARAETPGCAEVLHFNNAGAGLMPDPVLAAVKDHLDLEARIGGYEAAARNHDAIERVYGAVAELINCAPDEVAVIENATRAWDMAYYALARTFKPGDRVLTAEAEYVSNYLAILQTAKASGASVEVVPCDNTGQVSLAALEEMMDERVRLIALTHVPTQGGLVNPAAAVGAVARKWDALYLLDACQSAGQVPLDVAAIGCDMLSATGRKYLRGPRGTGFLYVRRDLIEKLEPPFIDLHAAEWTSTHDYKIRADARRFENWECYYAGKLGLGVAIDYALAWAIETTYARLQGLAADLRAGLASVPGVAVHDLGAEKGGIVTFTLAGQDPQSLHGTLAAQGINTSVSPLNYARLDLERRELDAMVRASLHYYNSEDEVARFLGAIEDLAD